jgi:mono/diheme cytochrome c family protein
MNLPRRVAAAFVALLTLAASTARAAGTDVPKLYAEHCASCHGAGRLGGIGPALLPENLGRLKRDEAIATIRRTSCDSDVGPGQAVNGADYPTRRTDYERCRKCRVGI